MFNIVYGGYNLISGSWNAQKKNTDPFRIGNGSIYLIFFAMNVTVVDIPALRELK